MNIMLASVLERTREIGIRRRLGERKDISWCAVCYEAVVLALRRNYRGCCSYLAVPGHLLGYRCATTITFYCILMAFSFSVVVGITFDTFGQTGS
jgi:putative ABC transport system permease protein